MRTVPLLVFLLLSAVSVSRAQSLAGVILSDGTATGVRIPVWLPGGGQHGTGVYVWANPVTGQAGGNTVNSTALPPSGAPNYFSTGSIAGADGVRWRYYSGGQYFFVDFRTGAEVASLFTADGRYIGTGTAENPQGTYAWDLTPYTNPKTVTGSIMPGATWTNGRYVSATVELWVRGSTNSPWTRDSIGLSTNGLYTFTNLPTGGFDYEVRLGDTVQQYRIENNGPWLLLTNSGGGAVVGRGYVPGGTTTPVTNSPVITFTTNPPVTLGNSVTPGAGGTNTTNVIVQGFGPNGSITYTTLGGSTVTYATNGVTVTNNADVVNALRDQTARLLDGLKAEGQLNRQALAGLSNALGGIGGTNGSGTNGTGTNGTGTNGATLIPTNVPAANIGEQLAATAPSSIDWPGLEGPVTSTYSVSRSASWVINVPMYGALDIWPLQFTEISSAATWIRLFATYVLTYIVASFVYDRLYNGTRDAAMVQGHSIPNMETSVAGQILGTGGSFGFNAGIAYAAATFGAVVFLWTLFSVAWSTYANTLIPGGTPTGGGFVTLWGQALGMASGYARDCVAIVDAFFPIQHALVCGGNMLLIQLAAVPVFMAWLVFRRAIWG